LPELPEVEVLRRTLTPHLAGAVVQSVRLHRSDICQSFNAAGNPVATTSARLLKGSTILLISRIGKQMGIQTTDGRVLVVQLGMSGQVLVTRGIEEVKQSTHVHAVWTILAAGPGREKAAAREPTFLYFRDPRRFGGLCTYPSAEALVQFRWSMLGIDGLLADGHTLARGVGKSARAIKAVLLDQSVIAGVGNIYADEALSAARIAPKRKATSLAVAEWDRLGEAIVATLKGAIGLGGSTLRDYRNADGEEGTATATHRVYGRGGGPCLVCRRKLAVGIVSQRTTVWCPQCQK